tara:strand:+ start:250 stop:426 length:177 start_codon:yes stop_codon:yes gene_type:complete
MVQLDLNIAVEGSYELRDKDGVLKQVGVISDDGLDKLAETLLINRIKDDGLELSEGNE